MKVDKTDDIVLKLIHYFVTYEDYRPVILTGVNNEIWLENFDKNIKLIRVNIKHIHNEEQFLCDLRKTSYIMKNIKTKTLSFKMKMLNILVDIEKNVDVENTKNINVIKCSSIKEIKNNEFINKFFPNIKETISSVKSDALELFSLTDEMNQKTKKDEEKLQRIFKESKPIGTYVLMALNILVFLLMFNRSINSIILNNGANNYILLQKGQWYRLISSMFIHGGIYHIFFNMYALYILGPQIERYYKTPKFLLIYFVSGILGSLFSAVFMSATSYSIGASGAIFGLLGSLSYFAYNYRATIGGFLKSSIVPVIVINLVISVLDTSVDLFGHIGGLIGGILISACLGVGDINKNQSRKSSAVVLILMTAFLVYMILAKA